jgi:F-type H+-transporting ATPase subunit delta
MMTEKLTTIARPYALAAFEYALDKNNLASWESMLRMASQIVQDKTMVTLLSNPDITQQQLVEVFSEILADKMDNEKRNFLDLLAEYGRLDALPEMAELFAKYRAEHEKTITVQVSSAIPLSATHQQKIIDALTKRLKRKVSLQCEVDESLIGGALIRAGDLVIDGSIRGKLDRLIESI